MNSVCQRILTAIGAATLGVGAAVAVEGDATLGPSTASQARPSEPTTTRSTCGTTTITQSLSQDIVPFNSVACQVFGQGHTYNSYIRAFDLATFGLGNTFSVCEVTIGVESASSPSGAQPLSVYLYNTTDLHELNTGTLIGYADFSIVDLAATMLHLPVSGDTMTGQLTVEVITPDGTADGNSFFIGSNPYGQTAPSYLYAEDCGYHEPTDLAAIGFPDMHIVMNVQGSPCIQGVGEQFEDVAHLTGWAFTNNSDPPGTTGWFQGNSLIFGSYFGAADEYIAADYQNASGSGTISNWLIMPELNLGTGTTLMFYTRTATDSEHPDRLEVRLSTSGGSTNVGATVTSVGDFDTLLQSINPNLAVGGYPEDWTAYTVETGWLPPGTTGRFAFRYFVENAGPTAVNGLYIGIDAVTVEGPDCNMNGIADQCEVLPDYNLQGDSLSCESAVFLPSPSIIIGSTSDARPLDLQHCGLNFSLYGEWGVYRPAWSGTAFIGLLSSDVPIMINVFDDCPANAGMQIACNTPNPNGVAFNVQRGHSYYVRWAAIGAIGGLFSSRLIGPTALWNADDYNFNGVPDECDCLFDVNHDGVVDFLDYIDANGMRGPCMAMNCPGDVDGDGVVDDEDLNLILNNLGPCLIHNLTDLRQPPPARK